MQTVLTWSLIPLRLDVLDDVYYMKEEMDYTMQQHNYFSVDTLMKNILKVLKVLITDLDLSDLF
jgi:hypothetical protein